MQLNAPKKVVYIVCVILIAIGIIGHFVPALAAYSFWSLTIGAVLLALACFLKGL